MALALALSLIGSAARAADPAPAQQPAGQPPGTQPASGAGGDGGARPKAASMVIEEASAPEPEPPAPVGDEKRVIGDFIQQHTDDVRDCYQKRLQDRQTLQGKLTVKFHIGPSGKVIGATADGIPDAQLVVCVVAVVRKWEFDKPQSGGKLRVAYPFVFRPEAAR